MTQVAGSLQQPYGYTGREFDAESGLYYYRARAYDPRNGVFLQVDPIGFNGGDSNLYAFVANNPLNWDDPTSLTVSSRELEVLTGAGMMGVGKVLVGALELFAVIASFTLAMDTPDNYPGYGRCSDRDPNGDKCEAAKARVKASKGLKSKCDTKHSPAENLTRLRNALEKAAARSQRDALCKDGPKGKATYRGERQAYENAWRNVGKCMVRTGRAVFYP